MDISGPVSALSTIVGIIMLAVPLSAIPLAIRDERRDHKKGWNKSHGGRGNQELLQDDHMTTVNEA